MLGVLGARFGTTIARLLSRRPDAGAMGRVKIGVLVPTRGELIRSPEHPSFDNILKMAEAVEEADTTLSGLETASPPNRALRP